MLQFRNRTPFAGMIAMFPDPDGIDTVFAIVKGTFTLDPHPVVAKEQIPVTIAPEYFGDPADSSIKRPSDVSLTKVATDVVVLGQAVAPYGRPVSAMDAHVNLGGLNKAVRVFGDRVWESNGATYSMSSPRPFDVMPLVWERCFGGMDNTNTGPCQESRNPVGTGFRASDGIEPVEGVQLPNLEDPTDLITSWKQTPAPTGFSPIAPHWEPRRSYAGTYDEQWQRTRSPYLPEDFDPRFLQIAPPGLIARGYLRGGEAGELRGFTPENVLSFTLPSPHLRIAFHVDGTPNERPAELDTVVLEPTERRVSLVWRASLPCDKKALRVTEVVAALVGNR
jgi:hypothetical protein